MLLGFIVMVVGVAYAIVHAGTSDATGALLPTAAGLITQFIGATFLFVYRSTIQQAIRYVQTLERMNTVGMAMAVLESINQSSDADLSDRTKAAIALALLANYGSEHDAVVKDMDEGRAETKKTGGATARRRLGQRSSESAPIVRSG
jgi:hypothetical protein